MGYQTSRPGRRPNNQATTQKRSGGGGFSTDEDYGGEFDPVAEGEHVVQITAATLRVSKKGNDIISFRFLIVGPGDSEKDRMLFEHTTLSQRLGLARLQGICKGVDPKMKGDQDDPENGINPWNQASVHDHLLGGLLVATVEHTNDRRKPGKMRDTLTLDGYRSLTDDEWSALEAEVGVDDNGALLLDLPDDAARWMVDNGGTSAPPRADLDDDIPY